MVVPLKYLNNKVTGITANADNKKMFKWQCH